VKTSVRGIAVLIVGALNACGRPSPIEESRDALLSWSASVEVGASAWLAGDVPSRYLGDLLSAAADGLRQERSALAKAPPSPGADSLQRVELTLASAVEQMRTSLESNDRTRVRAEINRVRSVGTSLRQDSLSSPR